MVTKGKELEYGSNLIFINNIDLSRNSLMGEILDELTRLVGLGTLNLSMNHLTRNVPKNIGNLRWLETLDLSKNSLSRHIPESMSSLSSLAHLNLSLNNLIGRIPSSNQLQTLRVCLVKKNGHSSLKIPQFPNSTRLAHIFKFLSLNFFYFLWDPYLSHGERLLLAYLPNPHLPPFSSLHISFCHHHSHSLTQKLHSQFNQRSTNNKNSQQFNTA